MARTRKRTSGGAAGAAILTVLSLTLAAQAQQAERAAEPPGLSADCRTQDSPFAGDGPLPNVAAALRSRKTLRILTIGASPSAGRRSGRGGYAAQIEELLEHAVKGLDVIMINRGVSGELAANAAARIKVEAALEDPDLVLWQVGGNDALAYVPTDEIAATVEDTTQWLRAHKIDVILVGLQGLPPRLRDTHYVAVRDRLRRLAADAHLIMVRRDEAMRMLGAGTPPPAPDAFDESEAGYHCLAQYVARAVTLGAFGKSLRDRPAMPDPAAPPVKP